MSMQRRLPTLSNDYLQEDNSSLRSRDLLKGRPLEDPEENLERDSSELHPETHE